ncbi:MAG: SPASM domain-containing protein [Candidatus Heimdallarchaeota archaeon]|nr:SPASM domain-containing protein [Candidatus Heimdallarchaeota archaeon]
MIERKLYHIFEKNNKFFLVDSFNQLYWNIGTNIQRTDTIQFLTKYGFFTEKHPQIKKCAQNDENTIKHLVINPSTECNLDCWFCYSKEYREKNSNKLKFEDIEKTIDILINYNRKLQPNLKMTISLGYSQEITMDFRLFKKVKHYIEKVNQNLKTEILLFLPSSNLLEINEEFVNYINQYGYLTVSVDLENENQKQAILRNLELFDQNVVKHLIIPMKAGCQNLLDIYREYGTHFDFVSMRPVRVKSDSIFSWNEESIQLMKIELTTLFQDLLNQNDEEILKNLLVLGPTDYIGRYLDKIITRTKTLERCPAGKTAFALSPNFVLYPCSGMMGNNELVVGKIETDGDDIEINTKVIDSFSDIENCSHCSIRFYCGGPCLDWLNKQNDNLKKNLNPYECQLNIHMFEEIANFLYELRKNKPNIYQRYIDHKGLKDGLNYPLNFEDFYSIFIDQ